MPLLNALLAKIRRTIHSKDFFERSRTTETAFTRMRVLGFAQTICFILWCARTSVPSTMRAFLKEKLGCKRICTRQAFSKRRGLIKPSAFEELFQMSAELLAKAVCPSKEYLRILAIDGTRVNLPTHPELVKEFGIQKSTGAMPQALVSTLFDVENCFTLDVQVRPHDGNEREMAERHIERIQQLLGKQKCLLIYDRGYPSGKLLELMIDRGILFLMRCPKEFLKSLDKREPDAWYSHRFHSVKQALTFRAIRVPLPNGTEEIFCTNLSDDYSVSEITDLYIRRWQIETSYNFLKNREQLENLSGITYCAFMQQLYACLLMGNLCSAYCYDHSDYEAEAGTEPRIKLKLDHKDECQCERKCDRRINMATVLAAVRSILPRAFSFRCSHLKPLVKSIDVPCIKNILRYDKKGKNKPRLRRHPSAKFTQSQRAGF